MRPADYHPHRTNPHLQPDSQRPHTLIHIFPSQPQSTLIAELTPQLNQRQLPFQLHQQPEDLKDLIVNNSSSDQKKIVLVEVSGDKSNRSPTIFPKDYNFPTAHPLVTIHCISLEQKTYQHLPCVRSIPQMLELCQQHFKKASSRKIQLRSVRSLHFSREHTLKTHTSLQKQKSSPVEYDTLFFQIDNYNSSEGTDYLNYEQLVTSLEPVERTLSFRTVSDLKTKIFKNKRFLILTGTNSFSQKTVQDIENAHIGKFDIIVLGDLRPQSFYLNPSIVLAASDSRTILSFLKTHGFDSPVLKKQERRLSQRYSFSSSDFKNLMNKIMVEDSEYSSSNNIFKSTFRSGTGTGTAWKAKNTRHWKIDKDEETKDNFSTLEIIESDVSYEGNKRKVKKIKKNMKPEIIVSGEIHNELFLNSGQRQPGFYSQRRSHEGPVEPEPRQSTFSSNREVKVQRAEPQYRDRQTNQVQVIQSRDTKETSTIQRSSVMIQPMFTYEKNRYHIESAIPQMSEEYQVSKKSSVMNAEADFSSKTFRNQLSSHYIQRRSSKDRQEEHPFRFSSNSISQSHQTINTSQQVSEYKITPQQFSRTLQVTSPSQSNHFKSPVKIIKKQETSGPQEVNYIDPLSNKNIAQFQAMNEVQTAIFQSKQSESKSTVPPSSDKKNIEKRQNPISNRRKDINPILARSVQRQVIPVHQATVTSLEPSPRQPASPNKPISPVSGVKEPTLVVESKEVENRTSKAVIPIAFKNSFAKNFEGFERVEKDGVVVYRRKVVEKAKQQPNDGMNFQGRLKPTVHRTLKASPLQKLIETDYPTNYPFLEQKQLQKKSNPNKEQRVMNSPSKTKQVSNQNLSPDAKSSPKSLPGSDKQTDFLRSPKRNITNESMLSRMSELHSDGSILRRNNMRFGVKTTQKEKNPQPSMLFQESKLKSGIYKPMDDNRKNVINRAIFGEDHIEQEKNKLFHINPRLNNFHFIIHEELSYLNVIIKEQLATPHDKIETFTSIENMYECLRPEKIQDFYEGGFIFTLSSNLSLVNAKILPEDYYLVIIDRNKGAMLEINEDTRRIKIDHLRLFPLVQRIILDAKLYQYVAYRSESKEIAVLADKFLNSEFILQKIETQYTSQIIDFYYCELPRLTRLYLLCEEKELPEIIKLLAIYKQFNPSFRVQSCKIICLITNILNNDDLILKHSNVTFINNPEEIQNQVDILRYAHYSEDSSPSPLTLDSFHYPQKYLQLPQRLEHAFPGRFDSFPYLKLGQVYAKLEKIKGKKGRHYLLLPEGGVTEKLMTQHFTRIFMLGKGKSIQSSMVRVLNLEELVELLRYY